MYSDLLQCGVFIIILQFNYFESTAKLTNSTTKKLSPKILDTVGYLRLGSVCGKKISKMIN